MKNIKKWFSFSGAKKPVEDRVAALEARIFKKKEEKNYKSHFDLINEYWMSSWNFGRTNLTLEERVDKIRDDFKELDHKFDLLERFLEIEYFKIDEKTATYDWANTASNEGFRKTKPYEKVKAEKEAAKKENNHSCCGD